MAWRREFFVVLLSLATVVDYGSAVHIGDLTLGQTEAAMLLKLEAQQLAAFQEGFEEATHPSRSQPKSHALEATLRKRHRIPLGGDQASSGQLDPVLQASADRAAGKYEETEQQPLERNAVISEETVRELLLAGESPEEAATAAVESSLPDGVSTKDSIKEAVKKAWEIARQASSLQDVANSAASAAQSFSEGAQNAQTDEEAAVSAKAAVSASKVAVAASNAGNAVVEAGAQDVLQTVSSGEAEGEGEGEAEGEDEDDGADASEDAACAEADAAEEAAAADEEVSAAADAATDAVVAGNAAAGDEVVAGAAEAATEAAMAARDASDATNEDQPKAYIYVDLDKDGAVDGRLNVYPLKADEQANVASALPIHVGGGKGRGGAMAGKGRSGMVTVSVGPGAGGKGRAAAKIEVRPPSGAGGKGRGGKGRLAVTVNIQTAGGKGRGGKQQAPENEAAPCQAATTPCPAATMDDQLKEKAFAAALKVTDKAANNVVAEANEKAEAELENGRKAYEQLKATVKAKQEEQQKEETANYEALKEEVKKTQDCDKMKQDPELQASADRAAGKYEECEQEPSTAEPSTEAAACPQGEETEQPEEEGCDYNAVTTNDGFVMGTCGSRIMALQMDQLKSKEEAEAQICKEEPEACGSCCKEEAVGLLPKTSAALHEALQVQKSRIKSFEEKLAQYQKAPEGDAVIVPALAISTLEDHVVNHFADHPADAPGRGNGAPSSSFPAIGALLSFWKAGHPDQEKVPDAVAFTDVRPPTGLVAPMPPATAQADNALLDVKIVPSGGSRIKETGDIQAHRGKTVDKVSTAVASFDTSNDGLDASDLIKIATQAAFDEARLWEKSKLAA